MSTLLAPAPTASKKPARSSSPRPLPRPRFTPEMFQPSGYDSGTPEKKARFANALVRFIEDGCPKTKWTRALYQGLSLHFRHIAHYDGDGFYAVQLSTPGRRAAFLEKLIRTCDASWQDRPDIWSDVQAALVADSNRAWLLTMLDRQ